MSGRRNRTGAFTRIELMVVGFILVILLGVLLPQTVRKKRSAQLVGCLANLKQVILAELLWINDSEGAQLSWRVSTNKGGTLEYLDRGKLFPHFRALSNELVTPNILVCAADNREPAKDFSTLGDMCLSYFMNMDVYIGPRTGSVTPLDEPQSGPPLFGDRNVTNRAGQLAGRIAVTESNRNQLGWSVQMHNRGNRSHVSIGNAAFPDGSVETLTSSNLQRAFKHEVLYNYPGSNHLALP